MIRFLIIKNFFQYVEQKLKVQIFMTPLDKLILDIHDKYMNILNKYLEFFFSITNILIYFTRPFISGKMPQMGK